MSEEFDSRMSLDGDIGRYRCIERLKFDNRVLPDLTRERAVYGEYLFFRCSPLCSLRARYLHLRL